MLCYNKFNLIFLPSRRSSPVAETYIHAVKEYNDHTNEMKCTFLHYRQRQFCHKMQLMLVLPVLNSDTDQHRCQYMDFLRHHSPLQKQF